MIIRLWRHFHPAQVWSAIGFRASIQKRDVLVQVHTQVGGPIDDVVAVHLAGKGFVLHSFSY